MVEANIERRKDKDWEFDNNSLYDPNHSIKGLSMANP